MNSRIDTERVVIASALLIGWAAWTAWRHLIFPALVAGGGLLLLASGWRPAVAPVPVAVALPPASGAALAHVPVSGSHPLALDPQIDAPSPDLPDIVRFQIRAAIARVAREDRAARSPGAGR